MFITLNRAFLANTGIVNSTTYNIIISYVLAQKENSLEAENT